MATIVSNTNSNLYVTKVIYFNTRKNSYINEYGLINATIHIQSQGRLSRIFELNQILNKEKPDVVYTWGNTESLIILLLKPFHSFSFINGSIRHGIRSGNISQYFRTIVLHLSKEIVSNSIAGLRANNLNHGRVLYNGIDDKFLIPLNHRNYLRQKLTGISKDIPLLISAANFVPYKDYYTILNSLKMLRDENYFFYYLILGEGPMKEKIVDTIKSLGLTPYIRLVGSVEEVSEYLKISDVFIHSSKGEGCSNAILEAMAAGLPIIATRTGGTPEIVNCENGFLFHYKNSLQLAEFIKRTIGDQDFVEKLGENSRKKIKEKFTTHEMMKTYYQIIIDVISKNIKPNNVH